MAAWAPSCRSMALKAGELPETWNLSHPDEIIALNRSYFEGRL